MWHRKVYIDLHAIRRRSEALADWLCQKVGWAKGSPNRIVILMEGDRLEGELNRRMQQLRAIDRKRDKVVAETKQTKLGF